MNTLKELADRNSLSIIKSNNRTGYMLCMDSLQKNEDCIYKFKIENNQYKLCETEPLYQHSVTEDLYSVYDRLIHK